MDIHIYIYIGFFRPNNNKKSNKLAKIRLKSGHCRWFDIKTMATTGTVSNSDYRFIKYKKAGQSRWLGKRPVVRGVAMNPVDHPHGGGEGKTSGGRPSVTYIFRDNILS